MGSVAVPSDGILLSLHGNQGSDFSDHTLGLWCSQPEMEKRTQHPAMLGTVIALLHILKSVNTYLVHPVWEALNLVFIKESQ